MISIIVAADLNGVIGHKGKLPWHLPRDLKHFSNLTKGHKVVMGRKTAESIVDRLGKPLPNRTSIVISRNPDFKMSAVTIVASLDEALSLSEGDEIFVIGGSEIYQAALAQTHRIYKTLVHTRVDGDAFFPPLSPVYWKLISEEFTAHDQDNEFDMTFQIFERHS